MEATVELGESPNGDLSTGCGIEGGGAEGPEGAASSSLFPAPAVVAPPLRFDESIVVAARDGNWVKVKELHEEGISLDSDNEVRKSSLHRRDL